MTTMGQGTCRERTCVSTGALARLRVHLAIVDGGVAPVVARYGAQISCRPGCSECCHQSFRVSELEGALLREGLAAAAPRCGRRSTCGRALRGGPGRGVPGARRRGALPAVRAPAADLPQVWDPAVAPRSAARAKARVGSTSAGSVDLEAELIVEPQAGWAADWIELREELGLGPQDNRAIAAWLREPDERLNRLSFSGEAGRGQGHAGHVGLAGSGVGAGAAGGLAFGGCGAWRRASTAGGRLGRSRALVGLGIGGSLAGASGVAAGRQPRAGRRGRDRWVTGLIRGGRVDDWRGPGAGPRGARRWGSGAPSGSSGMRSVGREARRVGA
jgi:hypothetical protein